MTIVIRKINSTCIGLLVALFCGAPTLADDTELLLVNPDPSQRVPNIMLIIDSSFSMASEVEAKDISDSGRSYAGGDTPFGKEYLYWS